MINVHTGKTVGYAFGWDESGRDREGRGSNKGNSTGRDRTGTMDHDQGAEVGSDAMKKEEMEEIESIYDNQIRTRFTGCVIEGTENYIVRLTIEGKNGKAVVFELR